MNLDNITSNRSIDDIVSSRREKGQYNILEDCLYDSLETEDTDVTELRYEKHRRKERQRHNQEFMLWPSDSDITLLRVKRAGLKYRNQGNHEWESVHDAAIPGDGTHLAESPSMVNLVTLIDPQKLIGKPIEINGKYADKMYLASGEYLVALSSWEPTDVFMRDIFHNPIISSSRHSVINNEVPASKTSINSSLSATPNGSLRNSPVEKRSSNRSNISSKMSKLFVSCFPRLKKQGSQESDSDEESHESI